MSQQEGWRECTFKGSTTVFARCGPKGEPLADRRGLVKMVYRPGGKVYKAGKKNLVPVAGAPVKEILAAAAEVERPRKGRSQPGRPAPAPSDPSVVRIWTDGACLGNPGPAGAGVLLRQPSGTLELARYLGRGTNNIGELTAIGLALERVDDPKAVIELHTDSSYSIGVLTQGWKARKNQTLIAELRSQLAGFPRLRLIKVRGHAGIWENERVDVLARRAAQDKADFEHTEPGPPGQ